MNEHSNEIFSLKHPSNLTLSKRFKVFQLDDINSSLNRYQFSWRDRKIIRNLFWYTNNVLQYLLQYTFWRRPYKFSYNLEMSILSYYWNFENYLHLFLRSRSVILIKLWVSKLQQCKVGDCQRILFSCIRPYS